MQQYSVLIITHYFEFQGNWSSTELLFTKTKVNLGMDFCEIQIDKLFYCIIKYCNAGSASLFFNYWSFLGVAAILDIIKQWVSVLIMYIQMVEKIKELFTFNT